MNSFQTGEMVQWVKAPVTKPNGLSLIPGAPHIGEGENNS